MFDPYKIKFVKDGDILEEVLDGYSGALIYKVIRGNKNYFLKLFNSEFNENSIKKCREILEIYKKLDIRTLDIIDYGIVEELNRYYIVYNFIEGKNLKRFTNADEYTLEDVREYGKYIGQKMLKLKNFEEYDKDIFRPNDIKKAVNKVIYNFFTILEDEKFKSVITKYFSVDELKEFKNKLEIYSDLLNNIEPKLINGDIKRSNIMVDNNNDLYVVDIESMKLDYDVINFRHQITWRLFDGNEKEACYVKGYFDGLYNDIRPENFEKFVMFVIIFNFFEASFSMYNKAEYQKLEKYARDCANIFKNDYYKKII